MFAVKKGDSTVLVSSHHLKKYLCQQQAEGNQILSHTHTHIQPSRGSQYRYSFVSLKLHHIIIVLINNMII